MKKFEKIFSLGSVNPTHEGHINLLKKGSKFTDNIDFVVGKKQKVDMLPWGIRAEALESAVKNSGIGANICILPKLPGRIIEVKSEKYDAVLIGSDLAISLYKRRFGEEEEKFFLSFKNMIIVERKGVPLNDQQIAYLNEKISGEVIVMKGDSDKKATPIRQAYNKGGSEAVKEKNPSDTWEIIKNNIDIFKNTKDN